MKRIVVNGVFDILHLGHLQLLEYARSYPNSYVLVLIDSDLRVRQLKGSSRPINTEYERAYMLNSLKFVDRVEIFDSEQELEFYIKEFQPDLMIKGSEYKDKIIIGSEFCKKIEFFNKNEKYSTTKKLQHIVNRR